MLNKTVQNWAPRLFPTSQRLSKGHQRSNRFELQACERLLLKGMAPEFPMPPADNLYKFLAIAYCDFVLLDGHWQTQVKRAQKRIAAGGLTFPIAKVFSERGNGIEKFLGELESAAPKPAS